MHLLSFMGWVWASQVAQWVKNPPLMEMQEMWAPSLGWEDPLEGSMVTHTNIVAWRTLGQRSLAGYSPWGHKESDTTEAT